MTSILKEHFEAPEETNALSWKYVLKPQTLINGDSFKRTKDVVVREYTINREAEITISIEKGTYKLKVEDFTKSSVKYESYFKSNWWEYFIPIYGVWKGLWELGQGIANEIQGKGFHCDASLFIEGQQDVIGDINLFGTGGTSDFKVETQLEPSDIEPSDRNAWIRSVDIISNKVTGTATLTDQNWFGDNIVKPMFDLFKINGGTTPNTFVEELNRDANESLKSMIQEILSQIDIELKNMAFIPPGGGTFTFQNLRFSNAGDLLFDIIYKAP